MVSGPHPEAGLFQGNTTAMKQKPDTCTNRSAESFTWNYHVKHRGVYEENKACEREKSMINNWKTDHGGKSNDTNNCTLKKKKKRAVREYERVPDS